jgi:hypothetical protein
MADILLWLFCVDELMGVGDFNFLSAFCNIFSLYYKTLGFDHRWFLSICH